MISRKLLDAASSRVRSDHLLRRAMTTVRSPTLSGGYRTGMSSSLHRRLYAPACSPFIRHNSSSSRTVNDSAISNTTEANSAASAQADIASSASNVTADGIPQDLLVQPPPFTSEAAIQAIHSIGTLKELGLAKWYTPPGILQQLLEFVHISTGFAWIASIAVATVMIRVTLFPLLLKSIRNTTKLAKINPEVKFHMAKLTKATKENDKVTASEAQMAVKKLFTDNQVNPLMSIVPIFIQMPVFIFFYYALQSMVALPVPGMEVGGLFWFTDLTAADPKHILPLATSALTLANFEIGAEVGASQGNTMNPAIKTLFRAMMCMMPFFTWNFPVAIFGYWFTSSLFSFIQGFMFRNPSIREKLNLPALPTKSAEDANKAEASGTSSVVSTNVTDAAVAGTKPGLAGGLTGGFWKNFNETVQGVKDMKAGIADNLEAAAKKKQEQDARRPRGFTKFEDLPSDVQARRIKSRERYQQEKRRQRSFSSMARRTFSSSAILSEAEKVSEGPTEAPLTAAEFGLDEVKDVLLEDMTSLALDELHEHRELRKYYRKIVYELPSLAEYTQEFVAPTSEEVLQFRYTTYFGEDHPAASKVVLEVDIRRLGLSEAEVIKLMKLAGVRVNHDTYKLKMSSERFHDPTQNKKYLSDTLDKLIVEAKDKTDMFEDVPLDRRHMKTVKKLSFPEEWKIPKAKAIEAPIVNEQ